MKCRPCIPTLWFCALISVVLICCCSPSTDSPLPTNSPIPSTPTLIPTSTATEGVSFYNYRVVNSYPHDREAFTQGLVYEEGDLYESTGLRGRSSLRRVNLETGEVMDIHELPADLFGEGITIYQDRIVQLTWRSHIGYVYDRDSFQQLQTFGNPTEGWGITHDGGQLIMSDGTSVLHLLDPVTYEEIGQVDVIDRGSPVVSLNELEYIGGYIYSNIWQTDNIAIIDPSTGLVVGWIDLQGLLSEEDRQERVDVLNGIAYDQGNDRLFVTGKLWPRLFEIELIPVK